MGAGSSNLRLAEYLRVRRSLVRPEDVGLSRQGRRRVPGLRREELAMLAGISSDYYMRLEQARDVHPSDQVLEALARALRLDGNGTAHLHQLSRGSRSPAPLDSAETVSPGLASMVDAVADLPVYVLGRLRDVLAINGLARALLPILRPGTNQLRAMFCDPLARSLYRDWHLMAATAVANLRATAATWADEDAALERLVGELSAESEAFRRLWERHEVGVRPSDIAALDHPLVGALELRYELLTSLGATGQVLVIYHAEHDPASKDALAVLRSSTLGDGDAESPTVRRPSKHAIASCTAR